MHKVERGINRGNNSFNVQCNNVERHFEQKCCPYANLRVLIATSLEDRSKVKGKAVGELRRQLKMLNPQADVNIMDEHQFKTHDKPILANSNVKLRTLQHKLEVKGEFQTVIRNETCGKPTKFVVVSGRIQSPPLISKETLIALGMLKIQPDGSFAEPNDLAISEETHNANTVKQAV